MFTGLAVETVRLGVKNIHRHKLRSFLTTLGIICGVGAVICMLSIGEGAAVFDVVHVDIEQGRTITPLDNDHMGKVCVIGDDIRAALFAYEDPLGESIWVSSASSEMMPFEVVGVLRRVTTAGSPAKG